MMHTQDTKFEWPLIQWISVKPLLRLNINDNQFRVVTETALIWGIELQQVLLYSSSRINNYACTALNKYSGWLRKNEKLKRKLYPSIPTIYAIFKASMAGLEGLSFGCLCLLANTMFNLIRSSYSLPFEIFSCLKPQIRIPTYPKI